MDLAAVPGPRDHPGERGERRRSVVPATWSRSLAAVAASSRRPARPPVCRLEPDGARRRGAPARSARPHPLRRGAAETTGA